MSADVRQALIDAPIGLSLDQLFAETGAPDERKFKGLISALKGQGKVMVGGERGGEPYYILADWPESALRENFDSNKPTQRTVTGKEFAAQGGEGYDVKPAKNERKKRKKANGEASPPEPAPRPEDGGAQFAIGESGELGIEKDETKIKLDAGEFARLRKFIDKTSEVWT